METILMMPAEWGVGEVTATLDLLKKVPDVSIYGLLLTSNPEHSLSQLISKRWYELHHLTGLEGPNSFLLVLFEPPVELDGYEKYWKQKLGEHFETFWNETAHKREPGRAFDYIDLFEKVDPSQFPCLVLFTDLNNLKKQKVVLRTIPNWDTDSVFEFLSGSIILIKECCKLPIDERMNCLESSLTSPSANAKLYFKHTGKQVLKYMKENPTKVVTTTVGFATLFANASLLPVGAATTILQFLKRL